MRSVRSSLDPIEQGHEPRLNVCLVVPPRQPVHSWRGVALEREERDSEQIDVDMMQERGEPFLLPCLCCLPYAFQRLGHAFPVLRPARVMLARVPFGPDPLLHRLRHRRPALFVGFIAIPRLCGNPEKSLANGGWGDSASAMIRPGFVDSESRRDLIELARDGSAEHRLARRANALWLLDQGMSCQSIAEGLFLDATQSGPGTTWYHLYHEDGIEGLASFGHEGGTCRLTVEVQSASQSQDARRREHPDRNAQFNHLNESVRAALTAGEPVISVDTKKKELVRDFKSAGHAWRPQGEPEAVRVHDFLIKELGRAVPYGIYDLACNAGWVGVGMSSDTAALAGADNPPVVA